jgi:hypothetical protein
MAKNYNRLIENVTNRINPNKNVFSKAYSADLATISTNDVLVYIRTSMNEVDEVFTKKSLDAGNNVKEHLTKQVASASFCFQGSIMTDTHIRATSDVDLLVITEKFYIHDSKKIKKVLEDSSLITNLNTGAVNALKHELLKSNYTGDALLDLKQLRIDCEKVLIEKYINCNISNPKSIKIKNLNLDREVDVVVANWYDDVDSILCNRGNQRGIQIYNKDNHSKETPDFPFLSIDRINEKSSMTNGRLKKMIRFLKNIKADSEHEILLNSYEFNAICFDINKSLYENLKFYELISVIKNQIDLICTNSQKADSILSVDGRENIFEKNREKLKDLLLIRAEVESIYSDLNK